MNLTNNVIYAGFVKRTEIPSMKLPATPRPDQNWSRFMFTIFGTTALVISYFPLYFKEIGFSAQIGYLYAIGPLISMFSNMIWSYTSDKYRTIKRIMNILIIGQLVTMLVLWQVASFGVVLITISLFYFSTIRSIRWRIRWPSKRHRGTDALPLFAYSAHSATRSSRLPLDMPSVPRVRRPH